MKAKIFLASLSVLCFSNLASAVDLNGCVDIGGGNLSCGGTTCIDIGGNNLSCGGVTCVDIGGGNKSCSDGTTCIDIGGGQYSCN